MNDCAIQLHEDYVKYCLERHVLPKDLTNFLISVLAKNKQAILIIGTNGIMLSNVELKRRRSRPLVDVTMEFIYEVYVRFCEAYDENIADFNAFAAFQRSGDLVAVRGQFGNLGYGLSEYPALTLLSTIKETFSVGATRRVAPTTRNFQFGRT